jgi:hypothetical protein
MDALTINLIHALLTSILALGPLSIAFYFDLKQRREATQNSR